MAAETSVYSGMVFNFRSRKESGCLMIGIKAIVFVNRLVRKEHKQPVKQINDYTKTIYVGGRRMWMLEVKIDFPWQ